MEWTARRVLVTGASGFIGSHLTERLAAAGAHVTAMVHGDPQYRAGYLANKALPGLQLLGGDLRDAEFVQRAVSGQDTVFHLGAVTSVQYSFSNPEEALGVNVLGTQHVCAAARAAGVRRVVHASTGGAYGNTQDGRPFTEDDPLVATSPYVAGKIGADHAALTYHASYGLPVCVARLFNAYGPRSGRFLIIPTIVQQFLQGPRIQLGDLRPTRPFIHVRDIVDALVAMAEADNVLGEVIHFGGPESISMGELVQRVAAIMGVVPEIEQDPTRLRPAQSEIHRQAVDTTKALRILGWKTRVTLDDGLRETIEWIRAGGYERWL